MTLNISTPFGDCGSLCAGLTFAGRGGFFMEEEIWKVVPDHPGVEASSFGRVRVDGAIRSLSLTGKGYKTGRGYLATRIRGRLTKAHRLVALAFHSNPTALPMVNHKDGTTDNNRPENLEWCDNSHNQRHAVAAGLHVALKGEHVKTSVITLAVARLVYDAVHVNGQKHRDVARAFGISKTQVTRIASKKSWAHIHESNT